jgi:hypothetical protein
MQIEFADLVRRDYVHTDAFAKYGRRSERGGLPSLPHAAQEAMNLIL